MTNFPSLYSVEVKKSLIFTQSFHKTEAALAAVPKEEAEASEALEETPEAVAPTEEVPESADVPDPNISGDTSQENGGGKIRSLQNKNYEAPRECRQK